MVSGTKQEEDESFDNINTLIIISTSVMILSCVMEVLMYFLYNNKVIAGVIQSINSIPFRYIDF